MKLLIYQYQFYLILFNIIFTLPFMISIVNGSNKYININLYDYIINNDNLQKYIKN